MSGQNIFHPIIGGVMTAGEDGIREVRSPFDHSLVGRVGYATAHQMEAAIGVAMEAFEFTRRQPAFERSQVLRKTSELIAKQKEEIATLICAESGKPIAYARTEVDRASFTFAAAAEAAGRLGAGRIFDMSVAPNGVGRKGEYRRFPLGVVAGITPFNFPLNLVAHKVAPALAAGNAVVLKPAPQTPLTSFALHRMLLEAGMDAHALSVVPCENAVAEILVRDPRIKLVSFTGSASVGWRIKALAAKARVTLELGGNGAVILDEIRDLDSLIQSLMMAAFNYAGQICISLQTLYVRQQYFEEVLERMIAAAKTAKVGDPHERDTVVGPMISEGAARNVESWIADAVQRGAQRHTGEFTAPNWITPTVLTNVDESDAIFKEEAFAPIVIVKPYAAIDDAIASINRGQYGLQAGLFASDVRTIQKVYEELEVGGLIVNDTNAYRLDTMPYGGVKNSGMGREGIDFAMEDMTEMKVMVTKYV